MLLLLMDIVSLNMYTTDGYLSYTKISYTKIVVAKDDDSTEINYYLYH